MAKTKTEKKEKKLTIFSYLYSIFNKKEYCKMDSKVYNKFMINRFLYSINNENICSVIDELNDIKYQNISDEHHYEILFTAISSGWYKIPNKLYFTENTKWNKLKKSLSEFGNVDCLKIGDISFIISLMLESDVEKLYEKIELLEKK